MNDQANLLSRIIESPDNDDLRLQYAASLGGRSNPRAELILLQCDRIRRDLPERERFAHWAREVELLYRFGSAWAFDAGLRDQGWTFERGFVERGNISFEAGAEAILHTLTSCPIRHLRELSQIADLQPLVDVLPHLERLTGLELGYLYRFDDALLATALNSAHLRNLSTLILHHDRNGKLADEQVIADGLMSEHRSKTEVLGVNFDSAWRGPSNRILGAIAESPYLRNLKRLHIPHAGDVGHNPSLDIETVRKLGASANLQQLEVLDLRGTRATMAVWEAISELPFLPRLKRLYLKGAGEILGGRPAPLNEKLPRIFEERVSKVDWEWDSIDLSDRTWPSEVARDIPPFSDVLPGREASIDQRAAPRPRMSKRVPVLALRGDLVFPNTARTLFVGRPRSVLALDAAIAQGGEIFLTAQNDWRANEPSVEALHSLGSLCSIVRMDGSSARRVIFEGKSRARLRAIELSEDGAIAEIEEVPDVVPASVPSRMESLRRMFLRLGSHVARPEVVDFVCVTSDPSVLADAIAGHVLGMEYDDRQRLLELNDVAARFEALESWLEARTPNAPSVL